QRRVDEAVLAAPPAAEPDERPRDRVFDLLMRRFDALQSYKPGFVVLHRELPRDPLTAVAVGGNLLHSVAWTFEAAGVGRGGIGGMVAVKLTLAAYLATQRVWLRDDSPDLAPTMAELDRRLRGVERWLVPGSRAAGSAPTATAT